MTVRSKVTITCWLKAVHQILMEMGRQEHTDIAFRQRILYSICTEVLYYHSNQNLASTNIISRAQYKCGLSPEEIKPYFFRWK